MQLGFINHVGQAVVVAGHQQVLTGMAFGQAADVRGQGLQHHIAGLAAGHVQVAHDLVLRELVVWCVGVPINALHIDIQTGLLQGMGQGGQQGGAVVVFGFGIGFRGLANQPSHVIAVDQCDAAASAGRRILFARMGCAGVVFHH